MSNFFSDVYQNVFAKVPGGDTPYSDPLGYGRYQEEEAEKARKAAEEAARAAAAQHAKDTLLTETDAMPSLTDSDRRSASRKAKARLLARGGRGSTILTDDPLGGGL